MQSGKDEKILSLGLCFVELKENGVLPLENLHVIYGIKLKLKTSNNDWQNLLYRYMIYRKQTIFKKSRELSIHLSN